MRAPTDDFADTEMSASVLQFPLVGITPRSDRHDVVHTRRPALLEPKSQRAWPAQPMMSDAQREARDEQADKAAAAALSQGLAVQAAYRNGESFGRAEGYRDGFRAGHTWHTIVGVLWGVAGTIITLGMLGFSAARAAKWLW